MNELIKIEEKDSKMLAEIKEIYNILIVIDSFEEFFIKVYQLKTEYDLLNLKLLLKVLDLFYSKYNSEAITYLRDCVLTEIFIRTRKPASFSEYKYKKVLISKFSKIFPNYEFKKAEVSVKGVGRIDILAAERNTQRPVIIELKSGKKNPAPQLIAYSSKFKKPILIGITESVIDENLRTKNIIYYTFKDLGVHYE